MGCEDIKKNNPTAKIGKKVRIFGVNFVEV